MLYIRYIGIEKLVVGDLNELMQLQRAASVAVSDEAISIPQLKLAVAQALEILIAKLDTSRRLAI